MWSILVDSNCPPDFPYVSRYFPWVVLNAPGLCLSMWVSSFLSFVALFWSWRTAWLIMQCSMFCFVLKSCPLSWDFLYDSFLTNFSRFCETSGLNKLLTLDTIGERWLNLRSSMGILFSLLFSIVILMWASLVLGPHFSSLVGSCIQSVLHFVALCFSELGAMIPFSLQLTIKLMLLLLELVPFAFTVALFVQWVKLKSSQFKYKKLTDSMWSILVDSRCPPDFTYENRYFAWVVLNAPDLCLSMWVSSFLSFVALFWSWPTAQLIMQFSVFCFVLKSCLY
jgi:hypothetical protein